MRIINAAQDRLGSVFVLAAIFLAGCASMPDQDVSLPDVSDFPEPVELAEAPFFPQEENFCGPAALATVLVWSGFSVTQQELAPQVYLPDREGTLQLELIAAARRYGTIPYVLNPNLETLLREVAAGNPVVVLQNLGLSWLPKWHYAVAVGFDLAERKIILRSGRDARHVNTFALFDRTWRRAGRWAVVVLAPHQLPDTAEELRYLESVANLERLGFWHQTLTAYSAALWRWPDSLPARLGVGNSYYALGNLENAEINFRQAVREHPDAAPAFNNLAQTLADMQRWEDAQQAAQRAVSLGGPLHAAYEETLDRIVRHTTGSPTPSIP